MPANTACTAYTWAAPQAVPPPWLALLSPAECEELGRGRSAADCLQRLAARALLRGLLQQVAGASVARAPLRRLASGALLLEGARALAVNVSHTRGLAAAAVSSQGTVGIDVERCDTALDHGAIAARFFHADERAGLAGLAEPQGREAFFALWTGKEAVAKALGLGLERDLPMKQFALHPGGHQGGDPGWTVQGLAGVRAACPLPAPRGYHAALALAGEAVAPTGAWAHFVEARHA